MTTSHPAAFLNGESRQVWAVRRDNGQPVYLEVGQADAMRDSTKNTLCCPYPGCAALISTRGGTRRDHFFHVKSPGHETGRESEFHLAAKAMLAQWLAGQVPCGATVREEQTVKDTETALHRRPDVLATGKTGRRVAFEVEYKSWSIKAWEQKQSDLEGAEIICLWLYGHTRVRLGTGIGIDSNEVVVPKLVAEAAKRALPVLLVNPVTREIGTLTNRAGDQRYDGSTQRAWLQVDGFEGCRFSPVIGIRTPSILRIEEAERLRAEAEAARAAHRRHWEAVWEQSPIRATLVERWGAVPVEFEAEVDSSRQAESGVGAVDAHWRAVIYEELVHQKRDAFRFRQVLAALADHGIEIETTRAGPHLHDWMRYLARLRLIQMKDRKRRYAIFPRWEFTPTGRVLGETQDTWLLAKRLAEQRRAEQEKVLRERAEGLESRRLTRLVIMEDGSRRWLRK